MTDTGHTIKACSCRHGWDDHLAVVGGCGLCSCKAHPPNQPGGVVAYRRWNAEWTCFDYASADDPTENFTGWTPLAVLDA